MWLVLAALLSVAVLVTFPLYFKDVNISFATATIPLENVSQELVRWGAWHWSRVALSLGAFVASALALRR